MPKIEVSLSKKTDTEIDRLVEEGEFLSREQAIEGLLSKGIAVFDTVIESSSKMDEDVFTRAMDDQRDPAMESDQQNDEHSF